MCFRGLGTATPRRYTKAECLAAFQRSDWFRPRQPVAPHRPDRPAARQRHRGAAARARFARRGVRDRPDARPALSRPCADAGRRAGSRALASAGLDAAAIPTPSCQYLHRLSLPRLVGLRRRTPRPAPTCGPSTSSARLRRGTAEPAAGPIAGRRGRGDARAVGVRPGEQRGDVRNDRRADQRLPVRRRCRRRRALGRARARSDINGRTVPR